MTLPIKTHTFRGKRYAVQHGRLPKGIDGACFDPAVSGKAIVLRPSCKGRKRLEILIHEALHACYWDLDCATAIDPSARDIASFLWRLGYRLPEDEQE